MLEVVVTLRDFERDPYRLVAEHSIRDARIACAGKRINNISSAIYRSNAVSVSITDPSLPTLDDAIECALHKFGGYDSLSRIVAQANPVARELDLIFRSKEADLDINLYISPELVGRLSKLSFSIGVSIDDDGSIGGVQ